MSFSMQRSIHVIAITVITMTGCNHPWVRGPEETLWPRSRYELMPSAESNPARGSHSVVNQHQDEHLAKVEKPETVARDLEPGDSQLLEVPEVNIALTNTSSGFEEEIESALPPPGLPTANSISTQDGQESKDRPVVAALEAFIDNHPDAALRRLSAYDSKDQDLLIHLLPVIARVEKGGLLGVPIGKQDLLTLIDVLDSAAMTLRSKAPLEIRKILFCSEVKGYGDYVSTGQQRKRFRPGQTVFIYTELANLSQQVDNEGRSGTKIAGTLKLRRADHQVVWEETIEQSSPDWFLSPRRDHYASFRFPVPDRPPGLYHLEVQLTDLHTGRTAEEALLFRIETMTATRPQAWDE